MAGIGFELKKMFQKKGLFSIIRAYGYAGIVCVGPMILGITLLMGIWVISGLGGASEHEQEYLNAMVTYTLLFSMIFVNSFSLVTTRFTADQLFMDKQGAVMPSFWGSVSIMLVAGEAMYGIFLAFSGVSLMHGILLLMLFGELIIVWSQMNYMTAIKDYMGILRTFILALLVSWGMGFILVRLGVEIVTAMLISVVIAYAVMAVIYYYLLAEYFPKSNTSAFYFLEWFDKYPQLFFLGLFLSLGLFGHIIIMWFSVIRKHIHGLFYAAPMYDIPAILAFLSILVTTINFVTSVEVNFYPRYRNYFSLFNDGGSLMDIKQAEREMKTTLVQELTYTFSAQFFSTIVFILAGTILLPYLPLGMNEDMLGIYRVLCIAYAFYAVGNCGMLIQLYFSDNKGAFISGLSFMLVSCIVTILTRNSSMKYYGAGFLAGGVVFAFVSLILLYRYINRLIYHVLCSQPVVVEKTSGCMTKISGYFEKKYETKFHRKLWEEELERADEE